MAETLATVAYAALQLMNEDYAGRPECAARDAADELLAACVAATEAGVLDEKAFAWLMRQYVAGFQDPNLSFEAKTVKSMTCGFSVRRFEDALYVTKVREDARFTQGDRIVLVDGLGLDEHLSGMVGNPVNGEVPERQLWDEVLAHCATVRVRHASGVEEEFPVRLFPKPNLVEGLLPPTVDVVENAGPNGDECAAIVTVYHFVDGSVLQALQARFADIQRAQRVVIDVRDVEEGMIGNAFGLLALFFDREVNLKDLMGESAMLTRYTKLNAYLRQQQLARLLAVSDQDGKAWVQAEIDHVAACAGKGFVKEAEYEEEVLFPPAPEGMQVFLLTDVRTAGPAERLAAIAQHAAACGCGKVISVGRATRGGLDYSNMVEVPLDERFSLVYAISKTEAAHEGRGVLGCGLAPDIAVPFEPAECTEDVVLHKALRL